MKTRQEQKSEDSKILQVNQILVYKNLITVSFSISQYKDIEKLTIRIYKDGWLRAQKEKSKKDFYEINVFPNDDEINALDRINKLELLDIRKKVIIKNVRRAIISVLVIVGYTDIEAVSYLDDIKTGQSAFSRIASNYIKLINIGGE